MGSRGPQDTLPIFQFCLGLVLDRGFSPVLPVAYLTETSCVSGLVGLTLTPWASYFAQLQRALATHLVVIKDLFSCYDNIALSIKYLEYRMVFL